MRRVISTEFRMHRAGMDSDLQEHGQRVSAALDKFAEERRTDAAVMFEPLRFLRDGLMTLRLDMTKVNDRLCVLQEVQGRSSGTRPQLAAPSTSLTRASTTSGRISVIGQRGYTPGSLS